MKIELDLTTAQLDALKHVLMVAESRYTLESIEETDEALRLGANAMAANVTAINQKLLTK